MPNYHAFKEVTLSKSKSGEWFHKTTVFADGTIHTVIYNKNFIWISSVVEYLDGRTIEKVLSIDDDGEVSIGEPSIVVDGSGNQENSTLETEVI